MNFVIIWAIAANGFQETIRDRVLYFIVFFALLLAIALQLLPEIAAGAEDKIFLDLGLAAIGFLTAIVAIFIGTGLVNKEIEKRTVLVLIPKPMSFTEFILGKHLGLSAVLGVMIAAMLLIYCLLLNWSGITYPFGSILICNIYLFFQLMLIIAVAIVFGVFTSSTLATLFSFGIYLMGNFSRDLVELGRLNDNTNIKLLTETIYIILPDLSRLDLKNEAVYNLIPAQAELFTDALYGLCYTAVLLAIAILVFRQRQF